MTSSLPQPIRSYLTQLPNLALKQVKNTIAIASGKGGVGKSTVAVNLAVALAREGARVGLLDADIYGPSIPMMMGIKSHANILNDKHQPIIAHGVQTMSIGFLTDPTQAFIWRGPMLAKALIQLIDGTAWDALDYLIVDLPPGTGDIQLSLVQKIPLAGSIVVSTPQPIATLDADKAIQMFKRTNIDIIGLLENMAMHTCSNCGHEESIFGENGTTALANRYQIPSLGQLPLDTTVRSQGDKGVPIATTSHPIAEQWKKIALLFAEHLATKPVNYNGVFQNVRVEDK